MQNPTDFLGHTIRTGDFVVYPVRRRSMMQLKRILVTRLVEVANKNGRGTCKLVLGLNDDGRRVTLSKPERCVIVPRVCAYCKNDPFSIY